MNTKYTLSFLLFLRSLCLSLPGKQLLILQVSLLTQSSIGKAIVPMAALDNTPFSTLLAHSALPCSFRARCFLPSLHSSPLVMTLLFICHLLRC